MTLKTPLYDIHVKLGGKMVDFGGYLLPIQYSQGILYEHQSVREQAGIFDVSHMAQLWIEGEGATQFLNSLITNDIVTMKPGTMKYTLMCNPQGGIIDDLLVYKFSESRYLLVCNAANRHKDATWIKSQLIDGVTLNDQSDNTGLIALQGPSAFDLLSKLCDPNDLPTKYYTFKDQVSISGINCLLSRNGYTGEDGFEIACHSTETPKLYQLLLEAGAIPCGLGARDTLRLEAGMPLYGHELSEDINPFEAKLSFFVKMEKETFIGKEALLDTEVQRQRVGIKLLDRGIAREGSLLYIGEKEVGIITTGTFLPTLKYSGAMAFIDKEFSQIGTQLSVDVRGRRLAAEIIKLPFYKKEN